MTSFDALTGWAVQVQGAFAITASGMLWDDHSWDEKTWNADATADSVWVNLDCQTLTASVRMGASQTNGVLTRYEAATLLLEMYDPDRLLDPLNPDGYARFGRLRQRAGLRMTASHVSDPAAVYPLFTGFLESLEFTWSDLTCRIVAADGASYLALYDPPAGDPIGAGETCAQRVTRILDAASWPAELRDVRAGGATLVADTLDGSAWEELLAVADADLGLLCVLPDGVVQFIPRNLAPWDADVSATVGDGSGLPIVDASATDTQPPINRVTASRVDGPDVTVSDPTSAALYGFAGRPVFYALARKDLPFQADLDVTGWVGAVLAVHAYPDPRISPVQLSLASGGAQISDPTDWASVAGLRIGHRWLVQCADLSLSKDEHIRGWTHTISRDPYSLTWDTSAVTTSAAWATPMIWDDPKYGYWDDFRWE